jgi:PadR family transcriptional regulator PadR
MEVTVNALKVWRFLEAVPDSERYGYNLMKATGLSNSSMYKLLHRMEAHDWLVSYLDPWTEDFVGGTGKRRRYYDITDLGRELMYAELKSWRDLLRVKPGGGHA